MSQTYNAYGRPFSFLATNKNLFLTATETIILEDVSSAGYSTLSLTITNFASSAGNISVVKIYGSNDGINYFVENASVLSAITPGSTVNATITAVAAFVRVTATSASTSNFDCYLLGTP